MEKEEVRESLKKNYQDSVREYLNYDSSKGRAKCIVLANTIQDIYGDDEGGRLIDKWVEEVEDEIEVERKDE